MIPNQIFNPAEIDFTLPGKHYYEVCFYLDGSVDFIQVPLVVINGLRGPGKTVACFGGTHGNEYEGQVAVRRLCDDLQAETLSGRVILIPQLNTPACMACLRESPLDGGNMNRVFPGDPKGTITSRIAWFVSQHIFPLADVVIDLHAAGVGFDHELIISFHLIEDEQQRAEIIRVASLFNPPILLAYSSGLAGGTLTENAEKLGKITIGSELGHSAGVGQRGVRHGYEGIRNVLRYYGMLEGEIVKIDPDRSHPPRLCQWLSYHDMVTAPFSGIFEATVPVGSRVRQGQTLGRLHDFERIMTPSLDITSPSDGILMAHYFKAPVAKGTTIAIIVTELD